MGRRLKASSQKPSSFKSQPVTIWMALPNKGWTLPQAADLLLQGYTDEYVIAVTGFDPRIAKNYRERT